MNSKRGRLTTIGSPYRACSLERRFRLGALHRFVTIEVRALLIATLVLFGDRVGHAAEWVTYGATELYSSGDFDGDSRRDVVIVDRVSGLYRIGYQNADGSINWASVRASGVTDVTGFSVGQSFAISRNGLAFAAPAANRINLFDPQGSGSPSLPVSVFSDVVGPNLVLLIEIPAGSGNSALEDIFIGSAWNNDISGRLSLLRNKPSPTFDPILSLSESVRFDSANAVRLRSGGPFVAGTITRGPTQSLRAYDVSSESPLEISLSTTLAEKSQFVAGFFSGGLLAEFVTWVPETVQLQVRPVIEPSADLFQFAPVQTFALPESIREVSLVRQSGALLLSVVFGDGSTAGIFGYQAGALTLQQTLNSPAGERFSAAVDLGVGKMLFTTAPPGGKTSTRFQQFNHNGSTWVAGAAGALEPLGDLAGRANVLLFKNEPFVAEYPSLLKTLQVGDWTSGLQLAGNPPSVVVQAATFGGASQGIGTGTTTALGSAPAGTAFGLVNQESAFLSIVSYSSAAGDSIGDARIVPDAGHYQDAIQVSWTNIVAGHQLHYRKGEIGNWTQWTNAPFYLFTNDVLRFYSKPATGVAKSAIRAAHYTFSQPPGLMDSDGDGVPDYVELGKGLDPLAGNDSDGDGFSDNEELLAGTSPANTNSVPQAQGRIESDAKFDLVLSLRPIDGATAMLTLAQNGQSVRAYDLHGRQWSTASTSFTSLPGVMDPAALLTGIPLGLDDPVVAVGTDPHFLIQTAVADKKIGRELLGLFPTPEIGAVSPVPHTFGHRNLTLEANSWIAAARSAVLSIQRPMVTSEIGPLDTLVALLFELKISRLLVERGRYVDTPITLFPFRPGDATRVNPASSNLAGLEFSTGEAPPDVRLVDALATIASEAKGSAHLAVAALRKLTLDVYQISSALNNSNPGMYAPPVDVIREFIASSVLPSSYADFITLSEGSSHPWNGVKVILDAVKPRPQTNLILRVRQDSFSTDCTRLENTADSQLYRLLTTNGVPFVFAEFFTPLPGTLIEVSGYSDVSPNACALNGLYVKNAMLYMAPTISLPDTDGDLLPDDLEWALFGSLGPSGFQDSDGDGVTTLQEFLQGSDPTDSLDYRGPSLFTGPPAIEIAEKESGQFQLTWEWPTAFASKLNYQVLYTTALGSGFTSVAFTPDTIGSNRYQVTLPPPESGSTFYQIVFSLKP